MKNWFEQLAARYLAERGYFVIKQTVPHLIVVHGVGYKKDLDNGTQYTITMPAGHKLMVLLGSVIVGDKDD